jgi:hypothetical protein
LYAYQWACQEEIVRSEEKVSGVKIGIVSALQLLQARLCETQEGMARRLGCTLGAWSKWYRGENTPRGDWMLRILALCPDEETRRNFLDIGEVRSRIPTISRPEMPKEEEEACHPGAMDACGRIKPKYYKRGPKGPR